MSREQTQLQHIPQPLRMGRWRKWLNHRFTATAFSMVTVTVLWELGVRWFAAGSLLIAAPSQIVEGFVKLIVTGILWVHLGVSLFEFLVGFLLSAVTAITLGILIGINRRIKKFLDPWITAIYATPIIALSPLFILAFGVGPASKVAVVWLLAFFPILINTLTGIDSIPSSYIETARAYRATQTAIFTKVMVPASLPFIVSGLRLAVGRGLIGVVVGELSGARAGLGYLITTSAELFDTPSMYVGVVAFAILGVLFTGLLEMLEHYLAPWRKRHDAE